MMWFDYAFGGRKSFLGLIGAGLITYVYQNLPIDARPGLFWHYVLGIAGCLGIFVLGNIQEHRLKNGNNNGGK